MFTVLPDEFMTLPNLSSSMINEIMGADHEVQIELPVQEDQQAATQLPSCPTPERPTTTALEFTSSLSPGENVCANENVYAENDAALGNDDASSLVTVSPSAPARPEPVVSDTVEASVPREQLDEHVVMNGMNESGVDVNDCVLPLKIKVSGRPRGSSHTTVIGTRRRGHKLKRFNQKTQLEREELAVEMLVKTPVRGKKRVYDEDDIKDVTDVPSAVIDKDFDVGLARRKLSACARKRAARVVGIKRQINEYKCPVCKDVCGDEEGDAESVFCDSCLNWIHIFDCSGERKRPVSDSKIPWFCLDCRKSK